MIPLNREAPNYRSMIGLIDGRTELKPLPVGGGPGDRRLQVVGVPTGAEDDDYYVDVESGGGSASVPLIQQQLVGGRLVRLQSFSGFEITVMAAKLAYENAAYIENVVKNIWKVHNFFWEFLLTICGDEQSRQHVNYARGIVAGLLAANCDNRAPIILGQVDSPVHACMDATAFVWNNLQFDHDQYSCSDIHHVLKWL